MTIRPLVILPDPKLRLVSDPVPEITDDVRRLEKEVQQHTDKFIKDIGDHVSAKERELMAV